MKPHTLRLLSFAWFAWTVAVVFGLACSSTMPLPEPFPVTPDAGPNPQGAVSYVAANPAACPIGTFCLQTADPATGAPWVAVANTISGSSGSSSSGGSTITANQGTPGLVAWPVTDPDVEANTANAAAYLSDIDTSTSTSATILMHVANAPGATVTTALGVQGVTGGLPLSVTGTVSLDGGTVSVTQGTSPWVTAGTATVSGTVAATQSGTWTVQQGSPPWSTTISGSVPVTIDGGTLSATQGTSPWVTTDTILDAITVDAGAPAPKALAIQGIDGGVAVSVRITGPFGQAPAATSIPIIDAVGVSNIGTAVAVPAAGVQISTGRNVVRFVQIYNGSGAIVIPFLFDGTAQPTIGAAPTWQTTSNSATTTTLAVSKLVFATGVRLVFSTTSGIYAAVPGATAGITYSIETDN